ncbi:helix-turn-helix domain-containing protein [Virgibacillus sediminis]|uniref:Helix-turn-helix domain-containing protein n=1 Tax=Virgibacillus sediminis TaxID=202260 RepID=A0ABV7A723_9BACI
MKILGRRLREARNDAGYKQIEAAEKLGISNGTLSGYERNYRDPDTETLHKMADLYNVKVDWLVGRDKEYESDKEKTYNSLAEMKKMLEDYGIEDLFFHNIDDWKNLTPEDIEEIRNHFEYIAHKARKRKEKE